MNEPLDLEPIKAREAAATKGPWRSMRAGNSTMEDGLLDHIAEVEGLERPWEPTWVGWRAAKNHFKSFFRQRDAEFIAHARQDIPALIGEVERLRALPPTAEQEPVSHADLHAGGDDARQSDATAAEAPDAHQHGDQADVATVSDLSAEGQLSARGDRLDGVSGSGLPLLHGRVVAPEPSSAALEELETWLQQNILDAAQLMTVEDGGQIAREFYRGWHAALENTRNRLKELRRASSPSGAPRQEPTS